MVRPLLASKLGSFCRRDLRCSGRRCQSPGETARNKRRSQGRTWAFANNYMECIYIYNICIIYMYNIQYIYTYLYNYELLWICIYIYIQICTSTYIRIYIYTYTYHVHGWMHEQKCATISGDFIQPPQKPTRRTRSAGGRRWDQVRHLQREQGGWNFPDLSHTSQ